MNYVYDLVRQMGNRGIRLDRKPLKGKRAYKLYLYLKKTKSPSTAGEAAVLGCTEGGVVHRKTLRHLECVLVNNLTALRPGEMTSGKLSDTRKYVWKLITIGRRQMFKTNSCLVVPYLKEAFHLAEANDLILPAKIASEALNILLGNVYFNEKEYLVYREKSAYYRELNLLLQKSILCFQEIRCLSSTDKNKDLLVSIVEQGLADLRSRPDYLNHSTLKVIEFYLEIEIAELMNEPIMVVESAKRGLKYLDELDEERAEDRTAFLTYLGNVYLHINDYSNGVSHLKSMLAKLDKASPNYGKLYEILILLCFRTGNYQEAAVCSKSFGDWIAKDGGGEVFKLSYLLYKCYLFLLTKLKWADSISDESRNINESCFAELMYSKDENFALHYLIICLIKALSELDYRKARKIFRTLPLPKEIKWKRYKYFYAAISTLFKQDFHRLAVDRHVEKHIRSLRIRSLTDMRSVGFEEVISYEVLWSFILDTLLCKRTKIR